MSITAKILRTLVAMTAMVSLISCGRLTAEQKPVAAPDLAKEYKTSAAQFAGKYQGKEVVVQGFTYGKPGILSGGKTGLAIVAGKNHNDEDEIWCEFDPADLAEFQKINDKQEITVKGKLDVRDAVMPPYMTQCKLVK